MIISKVNFTLLVSILFINPIVSQNNESILAKLKIREIVIQKSKFENSKLISRDSTIRKINEDGKTISYKRKVTSSNLNQLTINEFNKKGNLIFSSTYNMQNDSIIAFYEKKYDSKDRYKRIEQTYFNQNEINHNVTTFKYNNRDQIKKETSYRDGELEEIIKYYYNKEGQLYFTEDKLSNNNSFREYIYENGVLSQIVKEYDCFDGVCHAIVTENYNQDKLLVNEIREWKHSPTETISYEYNSNNDLSNKVHVLNGTERSRIIYNYNIHKLISRKEIINEDNSSEVFIYSYLK